MREWLRRQLGSPERRAAFLRALDKELAEGKTDAFFRALAHGHGQPPQALDIRHAETDAEGQLIYRAAFEDGAPVFADPETVPEETTE